MTTKNYPSINYAGDRKEYKFTTGRLEYLTEYLIHRILYFKNNETISDLEIGLMEYIKFVYLKNSDIDNTLSALVLLQYIGSKSFEYILLKKGETITISLPNEMMVSKELTFEDNKQGYHMIDGKALILSTWRALLCEDFESARRFANIIDHPQIEWEKKSSKILQRLIGSVFGLSDGEPMDLIQQFVNVSAFESKADLAGFDPITYLQLPMIDVMMKVFSGSDEKSYQEAMHYAVKHHHEYWNQPHASDHENGYFSMPLLTLAKVAFIRHGYRIGFETDYIPEPFYTQSLPTLSYDFFNKYRDDIMDR